MTIARWLLNLAYVILVLLVSPVLLYRVWRLGKYREGWREKLLGELPERTSDRPCLWLHAVSVGEVIQLGKVVESLERRLPDWELLITTTTPTGRQVAEEKFSRHRVCYFPLDFSWAVRRAMQRIRPTAIVLVELELWPNFILTAAELDIPLTLINGRISEKSFRGYSRIRFLMQRLLPKFALLAMQNDAYADRIRKLGAPAERVRITGTIKFDGIRTDRSQPATRELRQSFGLQPDETVFIAGSTQAPEEQYALQAWQRLRREFPGLRLILVPRHKERFEEVAELVRQHNLPLLRRSVAKTAPAKSQTGVPPVLLLDTLGELAASWGLADLAFVGGSLTQRGGQNMIEPAGFGAAVLFGPNTWNFADISRALLDRDAALVVHGQEELENTLRELLADPPLARGLGQRAQTFVLSQQGATEKTVEPLLKLLPGDQRRGSAAA